jgi:hypothetical protein
MAEEVVSVSSQCQCQSRWEQWPMFRRLSTKSVGLEERRKLAFRWSFRIEVTSQLLTKRKPTHTQKSRHYPTKEGGPRTPNRFPFFPVRNPSSHRLL